MRPGLTSLVLVTALTVAAPAHAVVLEPADAEELAGALAEVTEEQDVCYGWRVAIRDDGGGDQTPDVGSSLGVGTDPATDATRCERWVRLDADVRFTSDWSDNEDSASIAVASNLKRPPTTGDLAKEGLGAGGLLGDADDDALVQMVELLPLFVARNGEAAYVEAEPARTVPDADVATGTPGDDSLRTNGPALIAAGGAVVLGILLIISSFVLRRAGHSLRALAERPYDPEPRPDGRTADGPPL